MTTDKPQEPRDLIQICTDIYYECKTIKRLDELTDEALDWHNKQVEEVLEEIIDHYTPYRPVLDSETQRNVRQYVGGLLAERNKLRGETK